MEMPVPATDLTYEAAFAELETIVQVLEEGSSDLQDALRLFERGQALSRRCAELLDSAELKIKVLSGENLSDFEVAG